MTTCVICQKRETDDGQVCHGDRAGLAAVLRDIVDAYAVLSQPDAAAPVLVGVQVVDEGGWDDPRVYDVYDLPGGPVRVATGSAPISGSREAPVPVTMDLVDLTAPARNPNPARGIGGYPRNLWPEDQVGHQPVATILDQWVRDWISYPWCPGDHLPVPTVVTLAGWLRDRVELACDRHPAIDDFAAEMRQLLHRCRRASGDLPARPEVLVGVPCSYPACDGVLLHQPGDTYWAECDDCGRLWTEDEYREWVALVAAQARGSAA